MTELLTDPRHTRQDLKLMERVIKADPIEIPQAIIDAMPKVTGTIMLQGKPREKLAAGRLLLAFLEYNARLKESEKSQQGRAQTLNVGINIANVSDTGRGLASTVIERLRTVGVSGGNASID
jgi:hypothetical protein